jgi:hypothetical protein
LTLVFLDSWLDYVYLYYMFLTISCHIFNFISELCMRRLLEVVEGLRSQYTTLLSGMLYLLILVTRYMIFSYGVLLSIPGNLFVFKFSVLSRSLLMEL